MLTFLTNFRQRLRYPWLPGHLHGRLQPLRISRLTPERIPECVELYANNESHGLPDDHREVYREALGSGRILTFVADAEDGLAGTFGLQVGHQPNVMWLCYVIVRADLHRRGVGATLWLAALATQHGPTVKPSLAVSAVPRALGFYERLGFVRVGETQYTNGEMHTLAVFSPVTEPMTRDSRQLLQKAGAALPEEFYDIPRAALPPKVQVTM